MGLKVIYTRPDGSFGFVDILPEDKAEIDKLIILLRQLEVTEPVDRDRLRSEWNQIDRDNIREWRCSVQN